MGTLSLKIATIDDAVNIGLNLRTQDRDEVMAGRDQHPVSTVVESLLISDETFTVHDSEDGPIAIWGFRGEDHAAIPWMVSTPEALRHPKEFLIRGYGYLNYMLSKHEVLYNYVDVRNTTAIEWLKRLGFTFISREEEWGDAKVPFYLFVKTRTDDKCAKPLPLSSLPE